MKIQEKETKSIVTKSKLLGADYVINPYVGCQHACIYCYADFMKRFTGHSGEAWGTFVDVKINGPETLRKKKIGKNSVVLIGSVTDPYQPAEGRYRITRKCLEELLRTQPRLEILTKSPLILRDIDLLRRFDNLKVGISVGILDEGYARQLEPCVVSPELRLDALKQLHEAGISTYLFMSPIFPGISDINGTIEVAKGYSDEMMFENLNIRANNRGRIIEFIGKNKPDLVELYQSLPKDREYWDGVESSIREKCEKEGIEYQIFFHHGK